MSWSAKFMKRTTLPNTSHPVDLYTIKGPGANEIFAVAVDEKNRAIIDRLLRALAMSEA